MKIFTGIQKWATTGNTGTGGFGTTTGVGYYTTSSIYFDAQSSHPWVYMVEGY